MINTCTVRRYTEGVVDAYGGLTKAWGDHLVDQPCRLVAGSGREIKVGAEVVISNYRLFLEDIDITERDKVVIGSDTYEVVLVNDRQDGDGIHHLECDLVRVA